MKRIIIFLLFLLALPCGKLLSQSADAVKFFKSGQEAERTENYTEAFFYYSLAVDLDDKYYDAFYARGSLYKRMKNYGKAKTDLQKAVLLSPKNEPLLMDLGFVCWSIDDFENAVKAYTGAIQVNKNNGEAFFQRANSYNSLGQYLNAANDYRKVLEINPSNSDASDRLSRIQSQADEEFALKQSEKNKENTQISENTKTEEKTKVSEKTQVTEKTQVSETKADTTVLFVHSQEKEKQAATDNPEENETQQIVVADNTQVLSTENVQVISETKEEDKTKEESKTQSPEDYIMAGLSLFENKDYSGALEEYNKAVTANPDFYEAYYHRGRAYTELNAYDKAIKEYTKTIELNPNHEKAYVNRGYIYNEQKKYDKAIEDFKRGVEINPKSIFGYYNMGVSYFNMGDKESAVASFQQAARLGDADTQDWLKSNGYSW